MWSMDQWKPLCVNHVTVRWIETWGGDEPKWHSTDTCKWPSCCLSCSWSRYSAYLGALWRDMSAEYRAKLGKIHPLSRAKRVRAGKRSHRLTALSLEHGDGHEQNKNSITIALALAPAPGSLFPPNVMRTQTFDFQICRKTCHKLTNHS